MSTVATWIGAADVDTIASDVAAHPQSLQLGRLCFDVLSRQAEGKVLFVARDWVEARIAEQGLARQDAESIYGNVLVILERGAESARERMIISAFAVRGFSEVISTSADRPMLIERFVRHADWLERASGFSTFSFVDALLDTNLAAEVWSCTLHSVQNDAELPTPAVRARRAALVAVLARSAHSTAAEGLSTLADSAADPMVRAAADALGARARTGYAQTIAGVCVRPARGLFVETLRVACGIATLAWLLRALMWTIGLRREGELSLSSRDVRIVTRLRWFGRALRERDVVQPLTSVQHAQRDARFAWKRTVLGVLALIVCSLLGAFAVVDGMRIGIPWLIGAGIGAFCAGALLDWLLDVLTPALRSQARVTLTLESGERVCLRVSSNDEASTWMDAYAQRRN